MNFFLIPLLSLLLMLNPTSIFSHIPEIYFEKNIGQVPSDISYLARIDDGNIYFRQRDISFIFYDQSNPDSDRFSQVEIEFIHANSFAKIEGVNNRNCPINYFTDSDSSKWICNVPSFSKIRYKDIYEGVDALFYPQGNLLEYDFELAPGVDPSTVILRASKDAELYLDQTGSLFIKMQNGSHIEMKKPEIYQFIDEEKVSIYGEFILLADNQFGFSVPKYDKTLPLIIDPLLNLSLTYSSFTSPSSGILSYGGQPSVPCISIDEDRYCYLGIHVRDLAFPTTPNAYAAAPATTLASNIGIMKISPDGSTVLYATYFGSGEMAPTKQNRVFAIQGDHKKNLIAFCGQRQTSPFPFKNGFQTPEVLTTQTGGYLAVLNPNGNGVNDLLYCTDFSPATTFFTSPRALALDSGGIIYVVGSIIAATYSSPNGFPQSGPNVFQTTDYAPGISHGFFSLIDPTKSGSQSLIYSTLIGTAGTDNINAIQLDTEGIAYLYGNSSGTPTPLNFPASPGAYQTTLQGTQSLFITKFNPNLSGAAALIASTYLGGIGGASPSSTATGGLALDNDGNVCICGRTTATAFPTTTNCFQPSKSASASNGVISKLDSTLSTLLYSTYFGFNGTDTPTSIAVDTNNLVYITGTTNSTLAAPSFPITANALIQTPPAGQNAFLTVLELSPLGTGNGINYSTYLGGSFSDTGGQVRLDLFNNVYVTGTTASTTASLMTPFPTTAGSFSPTSSILTPNITGFVAKFSPPGPQVFSITPSSGSQLGGTTVTITGFNFTPDAQVFFGTTPGQIISISSSTIQVISPSGPVGLANLTVQTAQGTSIITQNSIFSYTPTPERIETCPYVSNIFQKRFYVDLSWIDPANFSTTGYKVYRDGLLIAELPASTHFYKDDSVFPSKTYNYSVIATGPNNTQLVVLTTTATTK